MAWDDIPDWAVYAVNALLEATKARDPYTYGHCRRVGRHAALLAKAAGLNEFQQKVVEFSAILHDIGKIGIPDAILLKPARLTPEEEAIIQKHPVLSAQMIEPMAKNPFFRAIVPGVRHHHERVDGLGYPDRIIGDEIPLNARILLIADTFDAMTTTRPYRKGLPVDVAYAELKKFSGKQFDAQLVKVFLDAHPTWGDVEEEISAEFVASTFKRAA